jgi:hypothetical protein
MEQRTEKQWRQINKTVSWLFEKINRMGRPLTRLGSNKQTQIMKTGGKGIIGDHCEQLYAMY